MARLKDGKQDKFVILLWGPAMAGKTVLASQFPNPYFIDLDGQIGSVRAMVTQQGDDINFPVINIDESPTDDEDFVSLAGQRFTKMDAWTKTKKLVEVLSQKLKPEDTLVLDNLSRSSEYLLQHIKTRTGHNPLQIQDWGLFLDEMRILSDYLNTRYTKCNTILIGHETFKKDEISGQLFRQILMPSSFSERLPSKCSEFLYLKTDVSGPKQKREVKRIMQSVPDPQNATGSRSMIPNINNPTYEKIRPYLENYLGRKLGDPTWTPKESPQT